MACWQEFFFFFPFCVQYEKLDSGTFISRQRLRQNLVALINCFTQNLVFIFCFFFLSSIHDSPVMLKLLLFICFFRYHPFQLFLGFPILLSKIFSFTISVFCFLLIFCDWPYVTAFDLQGFFLFFGAGWNKYIKLTHISGYECDCKGQLLRRLFRKKKLLLEKS